MLLLLKSLGGGGEGDNRCLGDELPKWLNSLFDKSILWLGYVVVMQGDASFCNKNGTFLNLLLSMIEASFT